MITHPLSYIDRMKASLAGTQDFADKIDWLHIWHIALIRSHLDSFIYDIASEPRHIQITGGRR